MWTEYLTLWSSSSKYSRCHETVRIEVRFDFVYVMEAIFMVTIIAGVLFFCSLMVNRKIFFFLHKQEQYTMQYQHSVCSHSDLSQTFIIENSGCSYKNRGGLSLSRKGKIMKRQFCLTNVSFLNTRNEQLFDSAFPWGTSPAIGLSEPQSVTPGKTTSLIHLFSFSKRTFNNISVSLAFIIGQFFFSSI